MTDLIKWWLVLLLMLPFVALYVEARHRIKALLTVLLLVTVVSSFVALLHGGFHQRPRVANLFVMAFFAWPFALVIAKHKETGLSWTSAILSVPLMSWYTTNLGMQSWYPTSGGGGGLGLGIGLLLGWAYMIPLFGFVTGAYLLYLKITKTRTERCS